MRRGVVVATVVVGAALFAAVAGIAAGHRRLLVDLIGAEFASSGLGPDDEPTGRGFELERLLDEINRPLLQRRHSESES